MGETIGRVTLYAVVLALIAAFGGLWAMAILAAFGALAYVFVKLARLS